MVKQLFEYYLAHQDELVEKYNGKCLVIAKDGVICPFEPEADGEAYYYGKEHFGLGNFILQLCTPGPEAYTFFNHHYSI